ncbi:PIF1 [Mytilus coruscus]|uniref:PIF1 n=1 Tax=Mytilus coruscus TaxID=42192 RepID=A0A6J8BDG9_MYTCO|nr:PIF1 [Mytilus coruscus]
MTSWPELKMLLTGISYEESFNIPEFPNENMRKDPLFSSLHFERRWKAFFKYVLVGIEKPLGNIEDYFARIEYQNREVKECNEQQQNRLLENALKINAIHEYSTSDTVHDEDICNFIPIYDQNAGGLPNRLILSLSTRVMLIRNIATEHGLVNGALGRLFYEDGHNVTIIEQVSQEFYYKGRSITRTQFPITPAWASTIHKVQGITGDKIVLGLGKSVFAEGQSYVALSRVKSLDGLAIESFDPTKIKTNQAEIAKMQTSREGIRSTKPIRVKIVSAQPPREYTNANKKKMVVVEAVIADDSGFKKLSCYNRVAFPFLKKDNSIMLLKIIGKTQEIVATGDSKIIMIPNLEKKINVTTQWNSTVDVRNGKIADNTAAIDFAFWRNLADFPLKEGEVIKITNGQMSKTSSNLPKITGGRYTAIEVEELLQEPISPEKKQIENNLLSCIPMKIKYIESPKKTTQCQK